MRLTHHTDFALRVLIHVSLNDGKRTTIKDIAQIFGISKVSLMKVVNDPQPADQRSGHLRLGSSSTPA